MTAIQLSWCYKAPESPCLNKAELRLSAQTSQLYVDEQKLFETWGTQILRVVSGKIQDVCKGTPAVDSLPSGLQMEKTAVL